MRITASLQLCAALIVLSSPATPALAQPPQGRGGIVSGVGGVVQSPRTLPATLKTEDELKTEIANRPSESRPYVELARLYQAADRIDDAERVLRDGLAYQPKSGEIFATLVMLFGPPKAKPERMLAAAEEWRQVDPSSPMPLMSLINAHQVFSAHVRNNTSEAMSHLDQALQVLDEARQARPNDVTLVRLRSMVLRSKADLASDPAEREALLTEANELAKGTGLQGMATYRTESGNAVRAWSSTDPPLAGAVRIGGNVRQPTKIRDVRPVYPPEAQEARVQGVVIIEATIDTTGRVSDARILRSIPLLDRAALDAVRQWEFTTTEVNGAVVPVIMTVTVQFTLTQ